MTIFQLCILIQSIVIIIFDIGLVIYAIVTFCKWN